MLYSQALLVATYVNGKPGSRTPEHERAEKHPFKLQHLFKETQIPKDLYASRLIQQFLIVKAIETQLMKLSEVDAKKINAFFTLDYLEQLWRTPGMQRDLYALAGTEEINDSQIAKTTTLYLAELEALTPKQLLGHFLFHVAGFMHGGAIIRSQYINPSNELTDYQIPFEQYDFSAAVALTPGKGSALAVYNDMMRQIDTIELSEAEYADILEQGRKVYATMANIYDDLCVMHSSQESWSTMSLMTVSLIVAALALKLLCDLFLPESQHTASFRSLECM